MAKESRTRPELNSNIVGWVNLNADDKINSARGFVLVVIIFTDNHFKTLPDVYPNRIDIWLMKSEIIGDSIG